MATKVTVYVDPTATGLGNGNDWTNAYTSLNAAVTAQLAISGGDLTARDVWLDFQCASKGGAHTADSTAVTINGFTTDGTRYVSLMSPTDDRHSGLWDATKYRLEKSGDSGTALLVVSDPYVYIQALQVHPVTTGTYQGNSGINVGTSYCRVERCLVWCQSDYAHTYCTGVLLNYADTCNAWNNIIYRTGAGSYDENYGLRVANDTTYLYNNTVVGFDVNYSLVAGATYTVKNNISQSSGTTGFANAGTLAAGDCNLSDRADAPGTNAQNSKTLTFLNAGSQDYHLAAGDTSAIGLGTDLSAVFTTDIDGATRTFPWDIGADQTAGAAVVRSAMLLLRTYP